MSRHVRPRSLVFAGVVTLTLGLSTRVATSQGSTPQATLTIAKTQYFPSESVTGSVAVTNTTSEPLLLNRFPSVLERNAAGAFEPPSPTIFSGPSRRPTPIAPGATFKFVMNLPVCSAISDPCSENVAIRVTLAGRNREFTVQTPERSYAIVADPTATFEGNGLSGNRPVVVSQDDVEGAIPQNILQLVFRFSTSSANVQMPPPESQRITDILTAHGLVGGGGGYSSSAGGYEITRTFAGRADDATLEAALDAVKTAFGTRMSIDPVRFVPSGFDVFPITGRALEAARQHAQPLADFIGTGKLDGSSIGSQTSVRLERSGTSGPFVSLGDFMGFDRIDGPTETSSSVVGILSFRVRTTAAFAGAATVRSPACCSREFRIADYVGHALREDDGISLALNVASDRPETYAIAETTQQSSDRLGLQPSAVALARAAERARALVADLGATSGPLTLAVAYPAVVLSENVAIVPAGAAVAPLGNLDAAWQALLATPKPVRTVTPTGPATPVSYAVSPFPSATSLPGSERGATPVSLVPIVLREPGTQMSVSGDVPARETQSDIDCATLVLRAQRLSLHVALEEAIARSRLSGKRLRHLVVAVAYPSSTEGNDPCDVATLRGEALVVHAPVELTFRTF